MQNGKVNYCFFFIFCCLNHTFSQPMVIAHRGASAVCVENSLSAFEKAIRSGVDYIETDVHQTSDSVVVIMHDFSVNRTCIVPGDLRKKYGNKTAIKEISSVEFSRLTYKEANETPPTLDSAIKLINGRCRLLIELKKGSDYYPGIEKRIIAIIKRNHAEEWVNVIHSFDKKALLEVNRQSTGMKLQKLIVFRFPLTSFNFSKKINKDKFEDWQGVNVYYRFITKRLIRKLHKQHKTVYAWTVNKKGPARRLIKKGVDGIISNKPGMIKALIRNNNL